MINLEIIEDEIISIEEFNEIDTIDLEIDSKNRLFFANNILTHNSGWDATDLTISNVSESAALLHTVDGLFGIITSPEMKAKGEYYLKYMADRVSGMENTRKKFEFNRQFMRIIEDTTSQIEDMDMHMSDKRNVNSQAKLNPSQEIKASYSNSIDSSIIGLFSPDVN